MCPPEMGGELLQQGREELQRVPTLSPDNTRPGSVQEMTLHTNVYSNLWQQVSFQSRV